MCLFADEIRFYEYVKQISSSKELGVKFFGENAEESSEQNSIGLMCDRGRSAHVHARGP